MVDLKAHKTRQVYITDNTNLFSQTYDIRVVTIVREYFEIFSTTFIACHFSFFLYIRSQITSLKENHSFENIIFELILPVVPSP